VEAAEIQAMAVKEQTLMVELAGAVEAEELLIPGARSSVN
jgi:hypothetical protein